MTDRNILRPIKKGEGSCLDCEYGTSLFGGGKNAYLAGLKAGKPKWHKVADGDLPKEEAEYLVIFESDRTKYTGLEIYYPDIEEWSTICTIVAWCEIPKYTEE